MSETSLAAIRDFLAQKRIAVVGASRNTKDFNASLFREFRKRGYDAVPVNPNAEEVEGQRCYPSVRDVAPPVDAALLLTRPDVTATVAKDCVEAGIGRVWMYRAGGKGGAVNDEAVDLCRKRGVQVIAGQCPMMFFPDTPWFHRFHGLVKKIGRSYPR